jgi:iron complex transport system ATP-binding protein
MINLQKIEFGYRGQAGTNSFHFGPIDLSIQKGELVSILGPNGSGKSTLLKIIGGILKPVNGQIELSGRRYTEYSQKDLAKKIAFVPQSGISVYPFTVYEIVMMGRTPYLNYMGYENNLDCEIVEEVLLQVDMADLKDKPITQISGGEVQRAFIARALAQQAEIVLLDEPNAHLDIKHQIDLFKLVLELNKSKGITFISVSHDLNLSARFFGRSVLLNSGNILFDGLTEDVLNKENIRSVFEVDSRISFDNQTNKLNIMFTD